jgi:hypothetical protein
MATAPSAVCLLGVASALPEALLNGLRARHAGVHWWVLRQPPDPAWVVPAPAATPPAVLISRDTLTAAEEASENQLRQWLHAQQWPYAVLYWPPLSTGEPLPTLLTQLAACVQLAPAPAAPPRRAWRRRAACEDCGDPACEHRLFQDLLAARASVHA